MIHHPGQERADDRHDQPPRQEHGHEPGPEVLHVLREGLHLRARRLPLGAFFLDLSAQRTVVVRQDRRVVDDLLPRGRDLGRDLVVLALIEAPGVLGIDVGWVTGHDQRILFHRGRIASAARIREMAAPRRHLARGCFLHQAWRDTLDQAVDMYGTLLDRHRTRVDDHHDDRRTAPRHAVDRIVHRDHRLGAGLLDPDIGDAAVRTRVLSIVPETQGREDQSVLANWTRGDRQARVEQTAARHAGRRQVAAPFLSRMTCVDEPAEGVSPTLSAGRLSRAHRAAGRRVEAFFLPRAQWEPVRNAFWARTGFPGDPAPAVEHLTTRLSDAFDRFLQGVPDNRQVVFDDDGWQLKTDPAAHPAPAHADSLVDLHRWLDTRSRSIRLADRLIEVENDLGCSVHCQRPGATRVDPGDVCARRAAILAHGCNLGLYTLEKVAPAPADRRLKYVRDWRRVEENPRAARAGIVHGISRLDAAGQWGDGTTSARDGHRFAMPHKVLPRTYSTRVNDVALECYSFVADHDAPFSSRPIECTDRAAPVVLDGGLSHERDLDLDAHDTDTHGYTEINVAAVALVGMRVCPRMRRLHRQRISCADPARDHGVLEPGRPRGRALTTEFVLQDMSEPHLRATVRRGLLKVEPLHALARAVSYGQRGRLSAREVYDQVTACSCLTLILACIVYWQAREISRLAAAPDVPFDPDLLRHVSPIEWKNVIRSGEITIDPATLTMRDPSRVFLHESCRYPRMVACSDWIASSVRARPRARAASSWSGDGAA